MTLQSFAEKLKKLDSRLYLMTHKRVNVNSEWGAVPIMARRNKRDKKSNYSQLDGDTARYLADIESGARDQHVGSAPWPEVPEFELFQGHLELARGWRTIVLALVRKGYGSLDKARKIFTSSLGETPWDRATWEEKVKLNAE